MNSYLYVPQKVHTTTTKIMINDCQDKKKHFSTHLYVINSDQISGIAFTSTPENVSTRVCVFLSLEMPSPR